jgi:hypothetical protein
MKEGICTQLFQRLGLTGKATDKQSTTPVNHMPNVQTENTPCDSVKRLNDFRLRQLSSGWIPGQTAAPDHPAEDGQVGQSETAASG